MEAKAILRYARISPRKVKIVLDLIKNKSVAEAMGILNNTPKAASEYLIKLLNSAIANATKLNGKIRYFSQVIQDKLFPLVIK